MNPEEKLHDAYRKVLELTVSEEHFTAEAVRARLEQTMLDTGPGSMAGLNQSSTFLDTQLSENRNTLSPYDVLPRIFRESVLRFPAAASENSDRYEITEQLGTGATCRVYAVRDNDLSRQIAVKVFNQTAEEKKVVEKLIQEARTAASLEHPNILPVYDIDFTPDGALYFTMRKIQGHTLGDAIRCAASGASIPTEIATPDDTVRIFLKLGDALRYAHSKSVIHQDIKPDNIMIGDFGEVLLLDWGSSSISHEEHGQGQLVGTPAYMSPEQARREQIDARSDIYSLGATFFHALTLRHPVWGDSPEEFWEKKRSGIIDPLTSCEREAIPHQLFAIALKALEANIDNRYQTMAELCDDLEKYQEGLAMSWRLYKNIQFSQELLRSDWVMMRATDWKEMIPPADDCDCGWRVKEGELFADNQLGYDNIAYNGRIMGDIRIEWDIVPLKKVENLNCFIAGTSRNDAYMFHIGAFSVPGYVLLTKGRSQDVLDYVLIELDATADIKHHICVEKEGSRLRLLIDGAHVIDYSDPDPIGGPGHQTFGFENSSGNSIRVSSVQVFYRPMPLHVSPLAIADRYLEDRHFDEARVQYEEISRSYLDTEIAKIALYKIGLCLTNADDFNAAFGAFNHFIEKYPTHALVPFALLQQAISLRNQKKYDDSELVCRKLAADYRGHSTLKTMLFRITSELRERANLGRDSILKHPSLVGKICRYNVEIRKWANLFGLPLHNNPYLMVCADAMASAGYGEDVLELYPEQHFQCADALIRLGRCEEVLTRYPEVRKKCAEALRKLGRHSEILQQYPDQRYYCALALQAMGRFDDVLREYPDQKTVCGNVLLKMLRPEDVIERYRDDHWLYARALRELGRIDEFATSNPSINSWILVTQRKYEEVIEKYPKESARVLEALFSLNRFDEIAKKTNTISHVFADAMFHLGRAEEIANDTRQGRLSRAEALAHLGRSREVFEQYPDQREICASLMIADGRFLGVLEKYPDQRRMCCIALFKAGLLERLMDEFPDERGYFASALLESGKFEILLSEHELVREPYYYALLYLGRFEDAEKFSARLCTRNWAAYLYQGRELDLINCRDSDPSNRALAQLLLGNPGAVIEKYGRDPFVKEQIFEAECMLNIRKLMSSDAQPDKEPLSQRFAAAYSYEWTDSWFSRFLFPAITDLIISGSPERCTAMCAEIAENEPLACQQQVQYIAKYILGMIGESEFLSQPKQLFIESRLVFAKALKEELCGKSAIELYRYYLEFPRYERGLLPSVEMFARWRAGLDSAVSVISA